MNIVYYIQRWLDTNIPNLFKNITTSICVFFLVCIALPDSVFEVYQYGTTNICIFALLMCAIWSGFFNSIALFYSESSYMVDDLQKFLRVGDYIIANIIIQTYLCITEAITCTVLFFFYYKFDLKGVVFENNILLDYMITFCLIMICSDMLGMVLGMFVNKITTAMTLIPVVLIVQMLLSGCLFELDGIVKSLSAFTIAKWGYSALGSIANLNSYRIDGNVNELFEVSSSYIVHCWLYLLLLTGLFILLASSVLFVKMNVKGDK